MWAESESRSTLQRIHIEVEDPACLHRVGMERHAPLATDAPNLSDWLNRAHLVVGVHHRHQRRLVGDGGRHIGGIHQPRRIHRQIGDAVALTFELLAGIQHGMVLDGGRDDVVATPPLGVGHAFDRQIVGLGAATGKDDLHRATAQHAGHRLVGGFQRVEALAAQAIDAAGVAELVDKIGEHRGENRRINRGGRRVIHVYRVVGEWHSNCSETCVGRV